jgi:hypothetical protein
MRSGDRLRYGSRIGHSAGEEDSMLKTIRVVAGLLVVTMGVASCGGTSGDKPSESATLFSASNLSKVLSKLTAVLGDVPVTVVKIEPRDIKVIGLTKVVTVDYNGNSFSVNAPAGYAPATFGIGVLDPLAVEKAVSAFESQSGEGPTAIAYVAVTRTGGFRQFASGATTGTINKRPFLLIFLRGARAVYQADIDGGRVKKIR